MKIAELRSGLSDLERMLENFGAKKQAGELKVAVAALAEFDDITLPELVTRIKAINAPQKKEPKPLDEQAVQEALVRLDSASHKADDFEKVAKAVVADKRMKARELGELARRFGGAVPEKTTKGEVSKFLIDRRLEMRRSGGVGATIDKMLGRTG